MHFEYEITGEEYAEGQALCHKLSGNRSRIFWAVCCLLVGIFFLEFGWAVRHMSLGLLLGLVIGTWWLYTGFLNLFPSRYFRRAYRKAGLFAKKFQADMDEKGFEVTADLYNWRVLWPGVLQKGESAHVFVFHSQGTVFIFGKKYLSEEQQREIRILGGLANV